MGRLIETKNVDHRIIRKHPGKEQSKKLISAVDKNEHQKVSGQKSIKRKHSVAIDSAEPRSKIIKTEDVPETSSFIPQQPVINYNEITKYNIHVEQASSDDIRLLLQDNNKSDLFLNDELRSSYENYVNKDFSFNIIDEISLEGLDGITIEGFWKRFVKGLECPVYINDNIKKLIWQLICKNEYIEFFKLLKPRGVLDIYDRFQYVDPEIGVVLEPAFELPEIYPFESINHPHVQGSCTTFYTRTDITSEVRGLSNRNAETKYDRSLVMVAAQKLRSKALIDETTYPNLELQNIEYCVLERIGRSRKHGELTQGNMSLTCHFKMDPKSVFHYKKHMIQNNLLGKQFFYIKSAVTAQNKMGRLLHLRRFFNKTKQKQLLITEKIVNILKERPHYRIEHKELKRMFGENAHSVTRVLKSQEFHRFVKTDCMYPYKTLYPDAPKSEYLLKSRAVEKFIRCMQLIDPYRNVSASWDNDQEDSDEEEEEKVTVTGTGYKIYNMESFRQVFYYILSKGKEGCSLQNIHKMVTVEYNLIRMIIKKLLAKNVITIKKIDKGKQRLLIYYARCFDDENFVVDLHPKPPKLPDKILSKIKQRQKVAIENSKQETAEEASTSSNMILQFPRKLEMEKPNLNCPYLVKSVNKTVIPFEVYVKAEFTYIPKIKYVIQLAFNLLENDLFEINKVLSELNPTTNTPAIRINFEHYYTNKSDVNHLTKLILLKAVLGEISFDSDTLNYLTNKRKDLVKVIQPGNTASEKEKMVDNKLQYMGSNPITVLNEREGDITIEIILSTPPAEFKSDKEYPYSRELTDRLHSRIQLVLNEVYEKKNFEDTFKMLKVIGEEELKEGYTKKIDRKSLARILKRLVLEGYMKIYKLAICDGKIMKTQTFLCHPSVSHMDSIIQSASQQLKWKYFIGTQKKTTKPYVPPIESLGDKAEKKKLSPFQECDVMNSIAELKEMNKGRLREINNKYTRNMGRVNGFKPKFIRMRIIHEFLYYLIYDNKKQEPLSEEEVEKLFKSYRIDLTKEELKSLPKIYCDEISWKMFLPPLPFHKGWIDGWALVCDVILRLPINVLLKIHNCSYDSSDLSDILSHPIKRFYLVKDLPETIRNIVLFKRKYLFDVHETLCRLAYCGLLQFGPEKYKEKDQVFIYLNRKASILDTSTSDPGYNKVSNKEYKRLSFVFNSQNDVDNYWFNVYTICLSTKLNTKQEGLLVTIVDASAKPNMVKALESRTPEEAVELDNGDIPGDNKGAGGLDSSLWSHIIRNWFWAQRAKKGGGNRDSTGLSVIGLRKERLEKVLPQNMPYNELQTSYNIRKVYLHTIKEKKEPKPKKLKKYVPQANKTSKSLQWITRRIPQRKKKLDREYYDKLDKIIIKKIGPKTRVKWSGVEDRILLLCRAVCIFLNPKNPKKQVVPFTIVRDVLRRSCPEGTNKTSKACQRRFKVLLSESTNLSIERCLPNFYKIKPIADVFTELIYNIETEKTSDGKPFKFKENHLVVAFVIMMSYVIQHMDDVESVLQGNVLNEDHLSASNLKYNENKFIGLEEPTLKYNDVKDVEDIKRDVLKSVLHSSLISKTQQGWAYQLFKIYQKYPDNLIRQALGDMKHIQAISYKKNVTKRDKKRSHTPFQLSSYYIFAQSTTFHPATAVETYKMFLNIIANKQSLEFSEEALNLKKYGQMLGINELLTFWQKIAFKFKIPQNTVILNPNIKDRSELVNELAVRYQAKLKKMLQENIDTEQEQEEGCDNYQQENVDTEEDEFKETMGETTTIMSADIQSMDDVQNSPLDLTIDSGTTETINRLKNWVHDCMDAERERRSPSPEFVNVEETATEEKETDEVERIPMPAVKKQMNKDYLPTLNEIKEGMLEQTAVDEERTIPYITDLSSLLNRDQYNESNIDEATMERLKSYFITQYAILEDVINEEVEELQDFHLVKYLEQNMRTTKIWEKIRRDMIVGEPLEMSEVFAVIRKKGGTQEDVDLANELICFVREKRLLGATGIEIKEHFKHLENICTLELIVMILVESRILLQVGVCTLTFVHCKYQSAWLIETFILSSEERKLIESSGKEEKDLEKDIEGEKKLIRVKIMPWTMVDGSINEENLEIWLCNILSHCMDYPKISLMKLCEKFCYIKPVDIFYLAQILQEIGSIDFVSYEVKEHSLVSSWESPKECYSSFLDSFENIYLEPNNISMTCMGSFLYKESLE